MANQLRQLALRKSDYESFSQACFERPSLTLPSLNSQSNGLESLTMNSLSLSEDNLDSLILPSCSLQSENASSLTLQSLSFTSDSLEETEEDKAHSLAKGGAETNSFAQDSLPEELCHFELADENAKSGAGTNSFTHKSFLDRILSLKRRLRIFMLVSFQLTCVALFLGTSYVTKSFQSFSERLCKSSLDSLISQLDLRTSLSLNQFGSTTCRSQLQQNKFQSEQLVQQQLPATTALATQLQHNQHQNKELDDNKLDVKKNFDSNQLQRNKWETKKQNKQLQEQPASASELRQLHLHQLRDQDQPFKGITQLSKKPCFTTTSFSKQELERLHLTRSSFQQDDHNKKLDHLQSAQLFAEHLADNSLHRNKPQQQQLVQQSFYPKMKKNQLQDLRSQLRKELDRAYNRISLQQLTLSNLLLKSFQLTSAALLSAALVAFSLAIYRNKSFQLPLQQLCLDKAQGGDLHRPFPPACCASLRLPALTLMSLSFAIAWLKPFSLARRRRALRNPASMQTTSTRTAAWKSPTFTTRAWTRPTSSKQACRRTTLKTTALTTSSSRRTSFSTSSSTASTSAFTTRTRSLMSTILLSIFLISFSSNKDIDSNSLFSNELSATCPEELVEQEVHTKAKFLQLTQLQQQLQDTELGQQEQNSQLTNSLASTQQLQNNQFQLQNLLWDQELEELLVAKSFPLGSFHDHLGKDKLEPVQLPQNLLENDEQKKLANKEFDKKNFDKKSFQPDSFDKIAEGAFRQQLLADSFPAASQHRQLLRNSLSQQSVAKAASLQEFSPAYSHRASGRKILSQEELREAQLADKNFYQTTFAAASLQTRTSARQLQKEQLYEENLPEHSFKALCLSSLEENSFTKNSLTKSSFTDNTFEEHSFKENSFSENSFEKNSFDKNSFEKNSFEKNNLEKNSFDKNNLEKNSFDKNSLEKNNLEKNSLDKNSFSENTFLENSFSETSFEKSSLTEETFSTTSLETETFFEHSFPASSFATSSLPPSSFTKSSLKDSSLRQSSFKESSFENSSFADNSLDKSSFPESSLAPSSLPASRFAKSSLAHNSFTKSSLDQHSFHQSTFNESSFTNNSFNKNNFEESSFDQSSLEESSFQSSFEQSSLEPNSFETSSAETRFRNSSFQKDRFQLNSFQQDSFKPNSLQQDRLRQTSFKQDSLQANSFKQLSFQQNNFQSSSFQENSFRPRKFERTPSCTELSKLQTRVSDAEFLPPLRSFGEASLPPGGELGTASSRGGVLRDKLLRRTLQLDLLQLEFCLDAWFKFLSLPCKNLRP